MVNLVNYITVIFIYMSPSLNSPTDQILLSHFRNSFLNILDILEYHSCISI